MPSVPVFQNFSSLATTTSSATATCPACAAGDSVAIGDLLVLAVWVPTLADPISGIADTKGNTWTQRKRIVTTTGTLNGAFEIWECIPTTAMTSSDTVTVTYTAASANKGVMIAHFNTNAATPFDLQNGQFVNAPANGSLSTLTTGTTTQAEEAIIGAYFTQQSSGSGGTWTPGSGFTTIGNLGWTTSNRLQIYMEYKTVTSTGTQTAPATFSLAPSEYFGIVTTWKGGTPPMQPMRNPVAFVEQAVKRSAYFMKKNGLWVPDKRILVPELVI